MKACGGAVVEAETPEIGWRDASGEFFSMHLTKEGRADQLFRGLDGDLRIFQLHGETFVPTPGMKLLATGASCRNQAVRVGECAYGIQGHFELTEHMLGRWMAEDPDLRRLDRDAMSVDYAAVRAGYEACGKAVVSNFMRAAGLLG